DLSGALLAVVWQQRSVSAGHDDGLWVDRCACRNFVREIRSATAFGLNVVADSAVRVTAVFHRARLESRRRTRWSNDSGMAVRIWRLRSCAFIRIPSNH